MKSNKTDIDESELIEYARGELENNDLNEEVWQKALGLSGQMEANAREKYILMRVAQLKRNMGLEEKYAAKQMIEKQKINTLEQLADSDLENSVLKKKRRATSEFRSRVKVGAIALIVLLVMGMGVWSFYYTDKMFISEMETLMRMEAVPEQIMSPVKIEESTVSDMTQWRLTITTTPTDAKVQILNIQPRYSDAIVLAEGKYHIMVSKKGYESRSFWIDLDRDVSYSVSLSSGPFALTIKSSPSDAKVQILNIKEVYRAGIELPKGQYKIRVSKKGYERIEKSITLTSDIVYKAEMFSLQREKGNSFYISRYRLPFSDAFPGCLEQDMRLPSVSEMREIIGSNKISEPKDAWFWTAEQNSAISYNIVQNSSGGPVRDAKLSERHYFYCIK